MAAIATALTNRTVTVAVAELVRVEDTAGADVDPATAGETCRASVRLFHLFSRDPWIENPAVQSPHQASACNSVLALADAGTSYSGARTVHDRDKTVLNRQCES